MKFVALSGTLHFVTAAAQWGQVGVAKPGPLGHGNPGGRQIYEDAGRTPNATNDVEFKRTYENDEETWTWRVNISEVAVPDYPRELGRDDASYSMDRRVINTIWQLGWPETEDDSFLDFLTSRETDVYFQARILVLPSNVTDKYDENDNGDCVPMLGEDCVKRIADETNRGRKELVTWSRFEECRDTLNQDRSGRDILGAGIGFGKRYSYLLLTFLCLAAPIFKSCLSNTFLSGWTKNSSNSPTLGNFSLSRSDSLLYYTTAPYEGENNTAMDYMKGAVQFFIMSFSYDSSRPRPGSDTGATLLCRIVDPEAAKEIDPDNPDNSGDSSDPDNSGDPNEDEPGAASSLLHLSLGTVFLVAFISSIITM